MSTRHTLMKSAGRRTATALLATALLAGSFTASSHAAAAEAEPTALDQAVQAQAALDQTARAYTVTTGADLLSTGPAYAGDVTPDSIKESIQKFLVKLLGLDPEAPKTMPASKVKKGVAIFLYVDDKLYVNRECAAHVVTPTSVTINRVCPANPKNPTAAIAEVWKDRSGRVVKMAFYKIGTVTGYQGGKTHIKRLPGDLPLMYTTPPGPKPVRGTF